MSAKVSPLHYDILETRDIVDLNTPRLNATIVFAHVGQMVRLAATKFLLLTQICHLVLVINFHFPTKARG